MEKLINKTERFYLDYNATSPLAQPVINWLAKGDFLFGNPSSHHTSGKKAHHKIEEVKDFLSETFCLKNDHNLFFHSGSTEGINTFFLGLSELFDKEKTAFAFVYLKTDHSILWEIGKRLLEKGKEVISLETDEHGNFPIDKFEKILEQNPNKKFLLNYTWVNNESGIVFSLSDIRRLRKKYENLIVHVDATQAPGRISDFNLLSPYLDAYTFSGHKFGALKGIGYTFWKKNFNFYPYLLGGGQQRSMRSGTENLMGIESLMIALQYLLQNFKPNIIDDAKNFLESEIKKLVGEKCLLLGESSKTRNINTSLFYFSFAKSDVMLASFDLEGIEVGRGSACSSGQTKSSPILKGLLGDDEKTKRVIRFSLPSIMSEQELNNFKSVAVPKILKVLKSQLK